MYSSEIVNEEIKELMCQLLIYNPYFRDKKYITRNLSFNFNQSKVDLEKYVVLII